MLVARNYQPSNLVRPLPESVRIPVLPGKISKSESWRKPSTRVDKVWPALQLEFAVARPEPKCEVPTEGIPELDHLLYLFACQVEWEQRADPSAAWDVIFAARGMRPQLRAHARSLLERPQAIQSQVQEETPQVQEETPEEMEDSGSSTMEAGMKTPYGLEIIESCMNCKASREGFFCRFSPGVLRSVDAVSHHTILPSGAVLFVEGQTPRGIFIVCSGIVKLSTTSKDGRVLILKKAIAGEVLGLSAAISGTNYEMTAETATPSQVNYISRQNLMTLLQNHSEVGQHAALSLSREFQSAYRDIHDLVLARSSSGKLARLLLSCAPAEFQGAQELHLRSVMTHEEMAQRIGSSRETVTRLLTGLKKRRLIRQKGTTLVIRNRNGLEALAL